jgi:hypothetical protein
VRHLVEDAIYHADHGGTRRRSTNVTAAGGDPTRTPEDERHDLARTAMTRQRRTRTTIILVTTMTVSTPRRGGLDRRCALSHRGPTTPRISPWDIPRDTSLTAIVPR